MAGSLGLSFSREMFKFMNLDKARNFRTEKPNVDLFSYGFHFRTVVHAKCTRVFACNAHVKCTYVHNFTGTNFSTELILVQKRLRTKSYENKFRPKTSCYTVPCNLCSPTTTVLSLS